MDALLSEIALKRKTMDEVPAAGRPTKYMRRGDIERLKEEQERKEREEKEANKRVELERKQREEADKAAKRAKVCLYSYSIPTVSAYLLMESRLVAIPLPTLLIPRT